ncbi:MAG: hypothetical protein KJ864_04560 [Candidatus Omnitrophica bacterium]|nr:hypothetical protein [Candidatus Omnitrophota bacterium]
MKKTTGMILTAIFICTVMPIGVAIAQDSAKDQRIKEEIRAHHDKIQMLKKELEQTAGSSAMGAAEYSDAESSYGQESVDMTQPVSSPGEGKPGEMRGKGPRPGERKPGEMRGKGPRLGERKPGEMKGKGPRPGERKPGTIQRKTPGGNQNRGQKGNAGKTSGVGQRKSGGQSAGNKGGGRKR